jgi:hypothetical protein
VEGLLSNVHKFIADASVPAGEPFRQWLSIWNERSVRPFHDVWEQTKDEVLRTLDQITLSEVEPNAHDLLSALGCFEPATRGSGTASVLAGLGIFVTNAYDFRKGVITAVNELGSDTDTIGAFVGGLAGAWSGLDAVPSQWAIQLQDYEYFMRVATELASIAAGGGIGASALLPQKRSGSDEADLLIRIREKNVNYKDHVYHPLFGRGVVESVDAQNLRRKDGARAVFVRVAFHIGQTCKFRYIEIPPRPRARQPKSRTKGPEAQGQLIESGDDEGSNR